MFLLLIILLDWIERRIGGGVEAELEVEIEGRIG